MTMTSEQQLKAVGEKLAEHIYKYFVETVSLYSAMKRATTVEKKEQFEMKWFEARIKHEALWDLYLDRMPYVVFMACQAKLEELKAR